MYENRVKKYEMKIWSKRDIDEKYFDNLSVSILLYFDTLIRFWILIKFPPNKYIFFFLFVNNVLHVLHRNVRFTYRISKHSLNLIFIN